MLIEGGYPHITSLSIADSIPAQTRMQQEPSPNHNSLSDGPLERRIFGRNVRRLLKIVHLALINPSESIGIIKYYPRTNHNIEVYVPWDVEEYYMECIKAPAEQHEKNKSRFPCPSFGYQNQPLTIVDIRGRIVLWYLPDLLSPAQAVSQGNSICCRESDQ